jgi:hypothetical protein
MITIEIHRRSLRLSKFEQNLATGAYTREALRDEFLQLISRKSQYGNTLNIQVHETVLERMMVKYSEQLVYQPLNEIRYWYAYSSGAFIEPGYPPLFYIRKKNKSLSPNKSAVAAIGEGVAGLLAQRLYKCRKLARPNHDFPDAVMESDGTTYLLEAKATLDSYDSGILNIIEADLPRMVAFTASCTELDNRPVLGLFVGANVISESFFKCFITEVIPLET